MKYQEDSIFNIKSQAAKTISDYLDRILKYCDLEPSTLIVAIIYLDKFFTKGLIPTEFNIHKILLVCITVANKYVDDSIYDNIYMSKVGGLPLDKLNELELEFLITLDYKLYVTDELFQKYATLLVERNHKKNKKEKISQKK